MSQERNILWVTPKWPFPVSDGARQAICSIISSVSQLQESIDLLCFVDSPIAPEEIESARQDLGVKNIFTVPKRNNYGNLSRIFNLIYSTFSKSSLAFTLVPFSSNELHNLIKSNNQNKIWTHVVFDGLHGAASFFKDGKRTILNNSKFIYRAHNLEANLWQQVAAKAGLLFKRILLLQEKKIAQFEKQLLSECVGLATVSVNDLEQFTSRYKLPLAKVVPIGFDFSLIPNEYNQKFANSSIKLLFVGSTTWKPNRDGLEWFLSEVWPLLTSQRKDIYLNVVGKDTNNLSSQFEALPGLKFLGQVENLEAIYAEASASIVPIFSGSGTRVKAIEAARFGKACISTQLGVEGLPLNPGSSYIKAESKDEWINILSKITEQELIKTGEQAYSALKQDFDKTAAAKVFIELLNST